MNRPLPVLSLIAFLAAGAARAELPPVSEVMREDLVPPDGPGRPGACTIVYYNYCSNWIQSWGWGLQTEEAGVMFDLPADCGKHPGESCENMEFWWYWRYTYPGWGYTLTYRLYVVDPWYCKIGSPIGVLAEQDPVERWNHFAGLGATTADHVALTAMLDRGGLPRLITDNNRKNLEAGCAPVPTLIHSVYYGTAYSQYCPPQYFGDDLGPVNILMRASFSCETTGIEPVSWGAIKSLFR